MSKAPKQRKAQIHYQPYQSNSSSLDAISDSFDSSDPILRGLNTSSSRNVWEDWNTSDLLDQEVDAFDDTKFLSSYQTQNGEASMGITYRDTKNHDDMQGLWDTAITEDGQRLAINRGAEGKFVETELTTIPNVNISQSAVNMEEQGRMVHGNIQQLASERPNDAVNDMLQSGNSSFYEWIEAPITNSLPPEKMHKLYKGTSQTIPPYFAGMDMYSNDSAHNTTDPQQFNSHNQSSMSMQNNTHPEMQHATPDQSRKTLFEQKDQQNAHTNPFHDYPMHSSLPSVSAQATFGLADNSQNNHPSIRPVLAYPHNMMVPGFMMYSVPVMNPYPPQMTNSLMPMGMSMLPFNAMPVQMSNMPMAMHVPSLHGLQPNNLAPKTANIQIPYSTAQFANVQLQQTSVHRANFVNIARKPEDPKVSHILKSLMEEEAEKKEKKLERNRDSARESRRKQQSYVETLENGIRQLQLNREYISVYDWGKGVNFRQEGTFANEQLAIVCGNAVMNSTANASKAFENLMANIRHRQLILNHSTFSRSTFVLKYFRQIGKILTALRQRYLELQVWKILDSQSGMQMLLEDLQLSEAQKEKLSCIASEFADAELWKLITLFKSYRAIFREMNAVVLLSPSLERNFQMSCTHDQLYRMLQLSEEYQDIEWEEQFGE